MSSVPAPKPPPARARLAAVPRRAGRRTGLWIVPVVTLAAVLAWLNWPAPRSAKPLSGPRTALARRGPLERTVRLSGVTVAEASVTLLAPRLRLRHGHQQDSQMELERLAAAGAFVRKGAIVAEFDRLYMQNRLEDYRASVALHESSLKRLRALLDLRRTRHQQNLRAAKGQVDKAALDLKKSGVISAIAAERYRLLLNEARDRDRQLRQETSLLETSEGAAIRRAELDLEASRLALARAQTNLERMAVPAPMDGLVVLQSIRRGSEMGQLQQGDRVQAGQPYMQIVDPGSMVVQAAVNQVDADHLRVGQRATVRFDAYATLELPARVTAIGWFANARGWRADWVRTLPVRLKLEAGDARVLPDLTASAEVVLDRVEQAVLAPRECLFGDQAWVRGPAAWEKRALTLGLANRTHVAVLSGLSGGEVLAAEEPDPGQ